MSKIEFLWEADQDINFLGQIVTICILSANGFHVWLCIMTYMAGRINNF